MRGPDCRGWRHCRDARGNSDETTCAGCGCASRSDINDDRQRGAEEALHDLLRRIEQTSRSVKLNDKTLSILRSGFIDAARNIARRGRPNRSIDINKGNLLRCENCGRASNPKDQRSNADGGPSSASPNTGCRSRIAGQASRSSALHFCLSFTVRCSTVRKVMLLSWAAA